MDMDEDDSDSSPAPHTTTEEEEKRLQKLMGKIKKNVAPLTNPLCVLPWTRVPSILLPVEPLNWPRGIPVPSNSYHSATGEYYNYIPWIAAEGEQWLDHAQSHPYPR